MDLGNRTYYIIGGTDTHADAKAGAARWTVNGERALPGAWVRRRRSRTSAPGL
jgi:hypothetical protein